MPLSEEELRLLEQMERELAVEDPKFVAALQGRTLQRSVRNRTILASVVFLAGMALMLVGGVSKLYWLAIIGFLVMLAAAMVGLAAWRGHQAPREPVSEDALFDFDENPHNFRLIDGGRSGSSRRERRDRRQSHEGFIQRLEQRWQRRRDQGY